MKTKLIKLPFLDIRNDSVETEIKNGGPNSNGLFLTYDGNHHYIDTASIRTDGSIGLEHHFPLRVECIYDSEVLTSKDKVDDLETELINKKSIINKLEDKINELSNVNESLHQQLKESLINCEELKTPKRNGCSEWVSAKTLIRVVEIITGKSNSHG